MKKLILTFVLSSFLFVSSSFAQEKSPLRIILRAGLSNVTGIVGLEAQANHMLFSAGWLPGSPLRMPISARYLFKTEGHSPIVGLTFLTNNASLIELDLSDIVDLFSDEPSKSTGTKVKSYHLLGASFSYRFLWKLGKGEKKTTVDLTVGGGYGLHLRDKQAKENKLKKGHPVVDISFGLHF